MYKNIAITKVVLVTSMNYNTSEKDLRNFFASCGTITNIRFLTDKNEVPTGSAYVAFDSHEAALKAYAKDDTCLRDRFLRVALNRTDAIEEIMTKEQKLDDKSPDEQKSRDNVPAKTNTNDDIRKDPNKVDPEKKKSEKSRNKHERDSGDEHRHRHKHDHHHKHKHHHHHKKDESSDEGIRYYTDLPE